MFKCGNSDFQNKTTVILILSFLIIYSGAAVGSLVFKNDSDQRVLGYMSVFFLVILYYSPISSLRQIIAQKCSSSIEPRYAVACLISGSIWLVYGIVISNPFLYVPNSFGILCSVLQIIAILVYPRKRAVVLPLDIVHSATIESPMMPS